MNYLMTTRNNAVSDFDTFFDDMFGNWGVKNSTIPSVDVFEDEKAYYLEAELPGYTVDDVNIHVEKHVLHISSEKVNEKKENKKFLVRERGYVKFDRSFTLPEGINEDQIEAEFNNGILTVTLPKTPIEQPKKIEVKIKK
jgi:HSP20 family molecular chaperone IbpA